MPLESCFMFPWLCGSILPSNQGRFTEGPCNRQRSKESLCWLASTAAVSPAQDQAAIFTATTWAAGSRQTATAAILTETPMQTDSAPEQHPLTAAAPVYTESTSASHTTSCKLLGATPRRARTGPGSFGSAPEKQRTKNEAL